MIFSLYFLFLLFSLFFSLFSFSYLLFLFPLFFFFLSMLFLQTCNHPRPFVFHLPFDTQLPILSVFLFNSTVFCHLLFSFYMSTICSSPSSLEKSSEKDQRGMFFYSLFRHDPDLYKIVICKFVFT